MRVIRERLARQGRLAATCQAAAAALQARAGSLREAWQDRPARRDLVEQILAVHEHAAPFSGEPGSDLTQAVLRLRGWALWFLNDLGDSAAQAIAVGEPLLADLERVLGPDHPDTLTSRNNLALAYQDAGRAAEAIPLLERTLADCERVLGPDHPEHPDLPEQPRRRLPGRGPGRRGDPAARADPGRPRAGPGPGPPRHPELPEQPRPRLPGRGPGRRGDPAARADPGRPGAGPGPGPPRHPELPEQPRQRLPGRGPGR